LASFIFLFVNYCFVVRGLSGLASKSGRAVRVKAKRSRALRKKLVAVFAIVLFVVSLFVIYRFAGGGNSAGGRVLLVTSMGNFTIELYGDMPITSGNFKSLVSSRAYDGTIFHRVVHNFVVQGGNVSGKGINVANISDELPNKHSNVRGSVAMAKTGEANSATSQFYINLVDNSESLDGNYVVFGRVVAGMDVVDAIGTVTVDANDKPLEDVTLISASIVG
jgi:peptidylprolyl isomerase